MNETDELFTKIAREHLNIDTLKERKMNDLDFHSVGVLSLRDALQATYDAGRRSRGRRKDQPKKDQSN